MDDLRLICDGHFDKVKKERTISLGEIIEKVDRRNIGGTYRENDVRGITNKKQFEDTKADLLGTDLSKFIVVQKNEFAYNSRTDGRDMLVLALNRDEKPVIVTWNYNAFKITKMVSERSLPKVFFMGQSSMPSSGRSPSTGMVSARQQPRPGTLMMVICPSCAFLSCSISASTFSLS